MNKRGRCYILVMLISLTIFPSSFSPLLGTLVVYKFLPKHAYEPRHVYSCHCMSQHAVTCHSSHSMLLHVSSCHVLSQQDSTCMSALVYILYILPLRLHLTSTHHEIQTSIDTTTTASISVRSSSGVI